MSSKNKSTSTEGIGSLIVGRGWYLPWHAINDLQRESVDRLTKRAKAAHYVNLTVRINGKDEVYEADWLKHLQPIKPDETTDRTAKLEFALRGLYWDQVDYLILNKLGGMQNHWMRTAREALGMDVDDIRPAVEPRETSPRLFQRIADVLEYKPDDPERVQVVEGQGRLFWELMLMIKESA